MTDKNKKTLEEKLDITGPIVKTERNHFERDIQKEFRYSADIQPGDHKYIVVAIERGSYFKTEKSLTRKEDIEIKVLGARENQGHAYHKDILNYLLKEIESKEGFIHERDFGEEIFCAKPGYRTIFSDGWMVRDENERIMNKGEYICIKVLGGGWCKFNPEQKEIYLFGSSSSYTRTSGDYLFDDAKDLNEMYEKNTKDLDIGTHTLTKEILESLLGKSYSVKTKEIE